jgi:hypothetical protein
MYVSALAPVAGAAAKSSSFAVIVGSVIVEYCAPAGTTAANAKVARSARDK